MRLLLLVVVVSVLILVGCDSTDPKLINKYTYRSKVLADLEEINENVKRCLLVGNNSDERGAR